MHPVTCWGPSLDPLLSRSGNFLVPAPLLPDYAWCEWLWFFFARTLRTLAQVDTSPKCNLYQKTNSKKKTNQSRLNKTCIKPLISMKLLYLRRAFFWMARDVSSNSTFRSSWHLRWETLLDVSIKATLPHIQWCTEFYHYAEATA